MTLTPIAADTVDRDATGRATRLYPATRRGSACACRVCRAFMAGASVHDIAAAEDVSVKVVEQVLRESRRHRV